VELIHIPKIGHNYWNGDGKGDRKRAKPRQMKRNDLQAVLIKPTPICGRNVHNKVTNLSN